MGNYNDIKFLSRPPVPEQHPRMALQNRAKLFSPYAALRGYGKRIEEEKQKQEWIPRRTQFPEEMEFLSEQLKKLKKGMTVSVEYFQPKDHDIGVYEELTGQIVKTDSIDRKIQIGDTILQFDDIVALWIMPSTIPF